MENSIKEFITETDCTCIYTFWASEQESVEKYVSHIVLRNSTQAE